MYEDKTYESILEEKIKILSDGNKNIDTREGSLIYTALAPNSLETMGMYIEAKRILDETYADTASREYLIKRVAERGIVPQAATSAVLKGVFSPNTLEIPIGSRLSIEKINYVVKEKMANGIYQIYCETLGEDGNKQFGAMIPIDYIDGLTKAELTELLIPGEDEESTESIRKRYYQTLDAESYGGNISDYKMKVSLLKGVGGTKVYSASNWNGGGTVKIVITDSNYDIPSQTLLESTQTLIDPVVNKGAGIGIAPIGHIVTIVGVNKQSIDIVLELAYEKGFDWIDVEQSVYNAIDDYFYELNEVWEDSSNIIVRISQIETRLLTIQGIIDATKTKINGVEENATIEKDSIVKRGLVSA